MKQMLSFILFWVFVCPAFAQNTETGKTDSTRLNIHRIVRNDSVRHAIDSSSGVINIPNISDLSLSNYSGENSGNERQNIVHFTLPQLPAYYDYSWNIYKRIPVNSRSWVSTARINNNYIGLGGLSLARAQYNHNLGDFMTVAGGVTLSKYNIFNDFHNDVNFNGKLRFKLSDRFYLNMFGGYSPFQKGGGIINSLDSQMFPSTNVGGALEFKVTDSWGIMTGAESVFDVFRRKWVTQPFIMPVFYGR